MSAAAPNVNSVENEGWHLRWVDPDGLDMPLYPNGLADLVRPGSG